MKKLIALLIVLCLVIPNAVFVYADSILDDYLVSHDDFNESGDSYPGWIFNKVGGSIEVSDSELKIERKDNSGNPTATASIGGDRTTASRGVSGDVIIEFSIKKNNTRKALIQIVDQNNHMALSFNLYQTLSVVHRTDAETTTTTTTEVGPLNTGEYSYVRVHINTNTSKVAIWLNDELKISDIYTRSTCIGHSVASVNFIMAANGQMCIDDLIVLTNENQFTSISDELAVELDAMMLDFQKLSYEENTKVIDNLHSLPENTAHGSTISYSSTDDNIVSSNDGTVTRPAYQQGNANVTLKAEFIKGAAKAERLHEITVLEKGYVPENYISNEDFSSMPVQNWTYNTNAGSVAEDSGKLLLRGNTSSADEDRVSAVYTMVPATTPVAVEACLRTSGTGAEFVITDSDDTKALMVDYSDGKIRVTDGAGITEIQWYSPLRYLTVKAYINPHSDIYRLFINDSEVTEVHDRQLINAVEDISFAEFKLNSSASGTSLWIDKLQIYNINKLAIQFDKELLELEDLSAITEDITLPGTGTWGSSIVWTSQYPEIISSTGAVSRQGTANTPDSIKLTATIKFDDSYSEQKEFFAYVMPLLTTSEKLDADMAAISITDRVSNAVTQIALPSTGAEGCAITWTSDHPEIINESGEVINPPYKEGVFWTTVTLTATLTCNGQSVTKKFPVNVLHEAGSNLALRQNISTNSLVASYLPFNAVDGNDTTLWKPSGREGVNLTMQFTEKTVFDMVVMRALNGVDSFILQGSNDMKNWTTLFTSTDIINNTEEIATFAKSEFSAIRLDIISASSDISLGEFEVYNTAYQYDEVKKDLDSIVINGLTNVVANISLPVTGENGSSITWSSSDTSIISNNGVVTRPTSFSNSKIEVTLTATATKNGITLTKDFKAMVVPIVFNSNLTGGGSGGGSGGGGSVSAVFPAYPSKGDAGNTVPAERSLPFSDVSKDNWAYEYISKLYFDNIVSGVSETAFEPDRVITREEFIQLIVKAFDIKYTDSLHKFNDVSVNDWYYNAVMSAYEAGITNGISAELFGVGSDITRQEMATMALRTAQKSGILVDSTNVSLPFNDAKSIADWAMDGVSVLYQNGIISGINGSFMPDSAATRAQAAKIICMLININ